MALKSTVFKCDLQVSDLDRGVYSNHSLVIARHPSETDERMMVRLLAFALNASEGMAFSNGLSSPDEPALSEVTLDGRIEHWIDVGLPDPKNVRRAVGRAGRVTIYAYGRNHVRLWWDKARGELDRLATVSVIELVADQTEALAGFAQRNMVVHCLVQDGEVTWDSDGQSLAIQPVNLKVRVA
jgi:uncharacterized protein YaeQ